MSMDSLVFNLDVDIFIAGLTGEIKKGENSSAREKEIKQVWPLYDYKAASPLLLVFTVKPWEIKITTIQ